MLNIDLLKYVWSMKCLMKFIVYGQSIAIELYVNGNAFKHKIHFNFSSMLGRS